MIENMTESKTISPKNGKMAHTYGEDSKGVRRILFVWLFHWFVVLLGCGGVVSSSGWSYGCDGG